MGDRVLVGFESGNLPRRRFKPLTREGPGVIHFFSPEPIVLVRNGTGRVYLRSDGHPGACALRGEAEGLEAGRVVLDIRAGG